MESRRIAHKIKIVIMLLSIGLLLSSCRSGNKDSFKQSPKDTVRTVAIFVLGQTQEMRLDYTFKVLYDTLKPIVVDSSSSSVTSKLKWTRDSAYYVPIVDSVRGSDGKAKKDSTGRYGFVLHWFQINKKFILNDFSIDMDEVLK